MKIRLYAFGDKLMSREVMDIPEDSGTTWEMVLIKPKTAIVGYSGEEIGTRPEMITVCKFEWTGKMEMNSGARVYNLIDIYKR